MRRLHVCRLHVCGLRVQAGTLRALRTRSARPTYTLCAPYAHALRALHTHFARPKHVLRGALRAPTYTLHVFRLCVCRLHVQAGALRALHTCRVPPCTCLACA
jgi:hypothetical protein